MSSAKESENQEKQKVFQTVLSSPGMTEKCKLGLAVSRQNIIFISRLIEVGLSDKKSELQDAIINALPAACREELQLIQEEILSKGNLTEFYERLKSL